MSDKFYTAGSPLFGRVMPSGWRESDHKGKANLLIYAGYAVTFSEALSMLGKHAAAVKRAKQERAKDLGAHGSAKRGRGPSETIDDYVAEHFVAIGQFLKAEGATRMFLPGGFRMERHEGVPVLISDRGVVVRRFEKREEKI